jgi:putrescine aminotransferase
MVSADTAAVNRLYRQHISRSTARLLKLMGTGVEDRAEGSYIYARDGRRYLDCGGFGVFLLGHRHPAVVAAVERELATGPLPSRLFHNQTLAEGAAALASKAPDGLEYVYFTTTGSETVDAAVKLGRATGRPRLVAMHGGFHGKTMGAVSIAGNPIFREPFEPVLPDVHLLPFGQVDALEEVLRAHPGECTVILEPVQNEAGVISPPPGYLRDVERLCREAGALFVLDEIGTGLGRLGDWWGATQEGVTPDVLLVGKALTGGVAPAAALVATPEAFEPLNRDPFIHTTTFSNSPLTAATVRAVIDVIEREDVIGRVRERGAQLMRAFEGIVRDEPAVLAEVRGRGLLIALESTDASLAGDLVFELLARGVAPNLTSGRQRVVRLTPAAFVTEGDVDHLVEAVAGAVGAVRERAEASAANYTEAPA